MVDHGGDDDKAARRTPAARGMEMKFSVADAPPYGELIPAPIGMRFAPVRVIFTPALRGFHGQLSHCPWSTSPIYFQAPAFRCCPGHRRRWSAMKVGFEEERLAWLGGAALSATVPTGEAGRVFRIRDANQRCVGNVVSPELSIGSISPDPTSATCSEPNIQVRTNCRLPT